VYSEIDVSDDDDLRADLIRRTGRRTVPQIFIDGRSIGGYEELAELDASEGLAGLGDTGDA
jgi:glutaredoxin 3